jgi:hypothetical protein
MKSDEVLEFIVVPPYHKRDKVAAARLPLSDFLSRRFRGFSFRVAGFAPLGSYEDDDFHVLPVMNFIDDEGVERMCKPPQGWIVSEIAQACRDFNLDRVNQ